MYTNYPYSYLHRYTTKNFKLCVIALPENSYSVVNNLGSGSVRSLDITEQSGTGSLLQVQHDVLDAKTATVKTVINTLNGTSPWDVNTETLLPGDIAEDPSTFPSSMRYLPHCYLIKDTNNSPAYKLYVAVPTVSGYCYTVNVLAIAAGSTGRYIQLFETADTSFTDTIWDGESDYFDYQGLDPIYVQVFAVNGTRKATAYLRHSLADVK